MRRRSSALTLRTLTGSNTDWKCSSASSCPTRCPHTGHSAPTTSLLLNSLAALPTDISICAYNAEQSRKSVSAESCSAFSTDILSWAAFSFLRLSAIVSAWVSISLRCPSSPETSTRASLSFFSRQSSAGLSIATSLFVAASRALLVKQMSPSRAFPLPSASSRLRSSPGNSFFNAAASARALSRWLR